MKKMIEFAYPPPKTQKCPSTSLFDAKATPGRSVSVLIHEEQVQT